MTIKHLIGLLTISALLFGCDMFAGPSANIPNSELRAKMKKCKANKMPSRTAVLACENYARECKRRNNDGKRIC